ncbi:MAG: hypothetical protein EBS01_07640 [Verrucomicrobia bacterium]|nr:hypothetical protein [Verrucomicrobiota bacterium]
MDSVVRTLTLVEPVAIKTQPTAPPSLAEGAALRLSVGAVGGGTLSYQWLKDGADLVGETAAALVRSVVVSEDAGVYQVRVSNPAGSVLSDVAKVQVQSKLSVSLANLPAIPLGGAVSFVAQVRGATGAALSYIWMQNGAVIDSAKSDQYRVASAALIDAGSYSVTVTRNDTGESATSNLVPLNVLKVPVVVAPPVSRTVSNGSQAAVTFSVVARSETALSYQWRLGDVLIPGATGSALKLASVSASDEGVYTVRVTNDQGAVEASARLRVLPTGALQQPNATAGSSDTGLAQTGWWVYWVSATPTVDASALATPLNGYWLLERGSRVVEGKTVVTPGRALWVLGSKDDLAAPLLSDEWAAADETVQDGVASDRSEFSVIANRITGASYTLSGRVEALGEAALYGAPESVRGAYYMGGEPMDVDLNWDPSQVSELENFGSPASLRALSGIMQSTLLDELGSLLGD